MPRMDVTEMPFAKLYPLLVTKAEKKGRTREDVDQVTAWLTGYSPEFLLQAMPGSLDTPRKSYPGWNNPASATVTSFATPRT